MPGGQRVFAQGDTFAARYPAETAGLFMVVNGTYEVSTTGATMKYDEFDLTKWKENITAVDIPNVRLFPTVNKVSTIDVTIALVDKDAKEITVVEKFVAMYVDPKLFPLKMTISSSVYKTLTTSVTASNEAKAFEMETAKYSFTLFTENPCTDKYAKFTLTVVKADDKLVEIEATTVTKCSAVFAFDSKKVVLDKTVAVKYTVKPDNEKAIKYDEYFYSKG